MASAARTIAPHGTGAGLGRTARVSQSGIASASQPGTTASRSRAVRSCRLVMGPRFPAIFVPASGEFSRSGGTVSALVASGEADLAEDGAVVSDGLPVA
jgi:hypothetical protein